MGKPTAESKGNTPICRNPFAVELTGDMGVGARGAASFTTGVSNGGTGLHVTPGGNADLGGVLQQQERPTTLLADIPILITYHHSTFRPPYQTCGRGHDPLCCRVHTRSI